MNHAVPQVSGGGASLPETWDVGALMLAVADALSARFNPVQVRGELSGFSCAASGHCYFSLKDTQGQVRCAIVDECNELRAYAFANERSARRLERAYALCLYEKLVGERRRAQYTPRSPIVMELLRKERATLVHHSLKLFLCLCSIHKSAQKYKKLMN
jgi:hypothetical protein